MSKKYILTTIIIFFISLFVLLNHKDNSKIIVESYVYKNITSDNNEILYDFNHYEIGIKEYCKNNDIIYHYYETGNNDFIGHKIIYNNEIYFYSGVMTDIDFINILVMLSNPPN
jgi:hypothetical protein